LLVAIDGIVEVLLPTALDSAMARRWYPPLGGKSVLGQYYVFVRILRRGGVGERFINVIEIQVVACCI
jgi:hypothetical protein